MLSLQSLSEGGRYLESMVWFSNVQHLRRTRMVLFRGQLVVPCQRSLPQSKNVTNTSWTHLNDQVEKFQVGLIPVLSNLMENLWLIHTYLPFLTPFSECILDSTWFFSSRNTPQEMHQVIWFPTNWISRKLFFSEIYKMYTLSIHRNYPRKKLLWKSSFLIH